MMLRCKMFSPLLVKNPNLTSRVDFVGFECVCVCAHVSASVCACHQTTWVVQVR